MNINTWKWTAYVKVSDVNNVKQDNREHTPPTHCNHNGLSFIVFDDNLFYSLTCLICSLTYITWWWVFLVCYGFYLEYTVTVLAKPLYLLIGPSIWIMKVIHVFIVIDMFRVTRITFLTFLVNTNENLRFGPWTWIINSKPCLPYKDDNIPMLRGLQ